MQDGDDGPTSALITESYWQSVRQVYLQEPDGNAELESELPELQRILPLIAKRISNLYAFEEAVDKGGAGLVSRVVDINLTKLQQDPSHKVYRALKLARPVETRAELLNGLIAREFRTLASVTHTNIIKLYYAESMADGLDTRPFYVMDFIENRLPLRQYVRLPTVTLSDFVMVLKDIMTGMAFLFEKNIVHNDIKPSNVLIQDGRGIISDLGSATGLNADDETTITFTIGYAHPRKLEGAIKTSDGNRMRRTLPSRGFSLSWDLYSLGLSILELLQGFAETHRSGITPYEYRYLRLLGSRLLDGYTAGSAEAYDFPHTFYDETKYTDVQEPLRDLAKLTGEYKIETQVPELDFFSGENIQVSMHGQTPISDRVETIIEHPAFKRLTSISQLGLISYVYPGATHTRGEHSLGTFGNAGRMVFALWNDPVNPVFRQIMRPEDLTACLLAALLHDVGQYPLAHDLEEADHAFFAHEEIGYGFFDEQIGGEKSLSTTIDELWKTQPGTLRMSERVLAIAHAEHLTAPIRTRILHSIVDGPIDADKLDYLVRDSVKLKVPYGLMIDFERISKMLTVIHEIDGDYLWTGIGIHEKGKVSAESVAFARYALFGSVYWHHTSRAIKAMLHHAAWDMLARVREDQQSALRAGFIQLILKNRLPSVQQDLFSKPETHELKHQLWPGINLADLQVLSWLWHTSGTAGKSLIEGLSSRRLYRRALVVSQSKRKDLWNRAIKFSEKASPVDRLALDHALQSEVLRHLATINTDNNNVQTRALDDLAMTAVSDVVQSGSPIVLVDIPPDRTEGMHDLKFFGETDRWRYYDDDLVHIRLEDSKVWEAIVDNFTTSLGKIRIFVHPKLADTIRSIKREDLATLLSNALTSYKGFHNAVHESRK